MARIVTEVQEKHTINGRTGSYKEVQMLLKGHGIDNRFLILQVGFHAFYKALRDTFVVQDLAQANCIAFGRRRWRVVTLAGESIDSSGTMSGGGERSRLQADHAC